MRRATLASFDPNAHQTQAHSQGQTQIPMSVQRKQETTGKANSRLSMAVPQRVVSRQSTVYDGGIPGTVSRQGYLYASQGQGASAQASQSGARNDAGYLRSSLLPSAGPQSQYAPPSTRRSSIGRRQSINPGQSTPFSHFIQAVRVPKDPRPVRDRAWLAKTQTEICDFLAEHNYPDTLTTKTLVQPTGKDFANIFKFLFSLYDPSDRVWGKKFEDDVALCLKAAGYPFADSISKSHLQAVGNMHSWPGIVAMLHWFVTSIRMREQIFDAYDEVRIDINAPNHIPVGDEPERPQAAIEYWAEYLAGLYPAFLASADYDASACLERLEDRFELSMERTRAQVATSKEQVEALQNELDRLTKQPSELKGKQKEQGHCQKDAESIQKYVRSLQEKATKVNRQLEEFTGKVAESKKTEQQKANERLDLKKQIEMQGLSEQEIQKLTSDRHQLDEANRLASSKLSEAMTTSLDLEVTLSRNFYRTEKLAEQYHALATKLGFLPVGPEGYEDVNFAQELNGSAKTPQDMVPDCLTRIRPAVLKLKAGLTKAKQDDGEGILQKEEELARVLEKVQDATEAAEDHEARYELVSKDLAAAKENLNAHVASSQAAMDQLAAQTNDLSTHLMRGLAADDQRLQALENEHHRLQADVNKLHYDNHEAFAEQLEAIISYKDYIEKRLEEMLRAAEA